MRRGTPLSQVERRPVHIDLESPITEENAIDPESYDKIGNKGIAILSPKNNTLSSTMNEATKRIPSMESMTIGSGVPNSSSSYSKLDKDNYPYGPSGSFTLKRSNQLEFTTLLTILPQSLIQKISISLVIAAALMSFFFPLMGRILILVYTCAALGILGSLWLSRTVLSCDDGTPEMRAVSDPIREGAEGFLRVQYTVRCMKIHLGSTCFHKGLMLYIFINPRRLPNLLHP